MKKIKFGALLFAVLLLFSLLSVTVSAASASVSVSSNYNSVTIGNTVTVTVKISGSDAFGNWKVRLNYDTQYLEYKSINDGDMSCSGGGGALLLGGWTSSTSGTKAPTCKVTFTTKKIGSAKITVSNVEVTTFGGQTVNVGSASKTVKINAKPTYSSDNKLSALSVAEGEISPAFNASTTAYTMSVPFETTSVSVSATANHGKASVSVDAPALVVGENTVTVTVKAENGSTKKYTVTVTRLQSELAGVTVKVGEKSYTAAHDPDTLKVPDGYTATTLPYGESKILCYAAPQNAIYIAYLISEADQGWYVYYEADKLFVPYIALTSTTSPYVILDPPQGTLPPAGYIPSDLTVGEVTFSAYKTSDSEEKSVYVIYAMTKDGNCGFYFYDTKNSSFVSYFAPSVPAGAETDSESVLELESKLEEEKKSADRAEIYFLAAALVAVILLICLILALVFRRRPKKEKAAPAVREARGDTDDYASYLVMGNPAFESKEEEKSEPEEDTSAAEAEEDLTEVEALEPDASLEEEKAEPDGEETAQAEE